jgi:hypothetical protein
MSGTASPKERFFHVTGSRCLFTVSLKLALLRLLAKLIFLQITLQLLIWILSRRGFHFLSASIYIRPLSSPSFSFVLSRLSHRAPFCLLSSFPFCFKVFQLLKLIKARLFRRIIEPGKYTHSCCNALSLSLSLSFSRPLQIIS